MRVLNLLCVLALIGCGGSSSNLADASADGEQEDAARLDADRADAPADASVDALSDGGLDAIVDGTVDATTDATADAVVDASDAATAECDRPADCVLASRTCCGVCGMPTAADVVAIPASGLDRYRDGLCDGTEMCPGCPAMLNRDLFATCRDHRCEVADIGHSEITSCASSEECILEPRDCCACGLLDVNNLVAINASKSSIVDEIVCGDTGRCECVYTLPAGFMPYCGGDGFCGIAPID